MVSTVPLSTVDPVALAAPATFATFTFGQGVFWRVLMPLWTVSFFKIPIPSGRPVCTVMLALRSLRCPVCIGPVPHAGATVTSPVSTPERVLFGVGMTVATHCFGSVDCRRPTAACVVDRVGHRFQVAGVHACALTTQVVNGVLQRDGADEHCVRVAVRQQAALADAEELVALHAADVNLEQPARGCVPTVNNGDELPEPLGQTRVAKQCGTIEHIDSSQSVVPRGVDAPAGLLAAIVPAGGARQ